MESHASISALALPAFNLAVLIGILVYFLRAPIRNMVQQRHENLRSELDAVREQLHAAQARHAELSAKLGAIDSELRSIREEGRQDAERLGKQLAEDAKRNAASIVSDAQAASKNLFNDLRAQLYNELGERVLNRAETMIRDRLTGEDRTKIRQDFARQLESVQ